MIAVLLKTCITFFALYGFFALIKDLFYEIIKKDNSQNDDIAVVIKVKNACESLESTVRMIILKCLSVSFGGYIPDIIIVDMGSDDDTAVIAQKLCDDYSFIYYTTYELYEKAKR